MDEYVEYTGFVIVEGHPAEIKIARPSSSYLPFLYVRDKDGEWVFYGKAQSGAGPMN